MFLHFSSFFEEIDFVKIKKGFDEAK